MKLKQSDSSNTNKTIKAVAGQRNMNDDDDCSIYVVGLAHNASDNDENKQMSEQIIKWINTMANKRVRFARTIHRI